MSRRHFNRRPRSPFGGLRPEDARAPDDRPGAGRLQAGAGFHWPGSRWWASDRIRLLAVCGLLLLAVGLVFGQTAGFGFVNYDDDQYVYENPMVSRGLGGEQLRWAFIQSHNSNWHPLTWISLMLDRNLYGPIAGGHHFTNVLLHAAAAILLFLILRRATGRFWPSAAVAALFAVHPLRAESVAWVTERKDVLSGVCFMLTLLAYLRYASRPFSLARYLSVIGLFALGLMSKPTLVTLPLLLLLLDYWPLGRMGRGERKEGESGRWGEGEISLQTVVRSSPPLPLSPSPSLVRLVLEKVPLLLLTAGSCALTLWAPGKENTFLSTELVPLWSRIANAPVSYAAYLGQFFCPAGLAVIYPWQDVDLPPWKVAGAVLVLAAVTAAAVVCRRKRPYFLVGWLWCLGMLVPVIGLVQVGQQARADRFTYLPQIGLCIAVIWWISDSFPSWPSRRWACAAASCVLALLMAWAWRQVSFWSDSSALWNRDLACTSHNSIAHLGYAKADFGRADVAIAHYRQVLEVHSAFPALDLFYDAEAYKNLGVVLADRRQFAEAVAYYQKALAINANDAEAYYDMGVALAACGRTDEAIANYQRAVEIKSDYAAAHNNLGLALASRERLDEAMVQFQQALEIDPSYADAHNNLGNVLVNRGRIDQATAHYRTALELKPDYAEAHFNLGLALTDQGRTEEATEHYQQALILATRQNKPALVEKLKAQLRPFQNNKIQ